MSSSTIKLSFSTAAKIATSCLYALLLAWLYKSEVSAFWEYQGFRSVETPFAMIKITVATMLTAAMLPNGTDTRTYLLTGTSFLFFIPAIVYSFSSAADYRYIAVLFFVIFVSIHLSAIRLKPILLKPIKRQHFLRFTLAVSIALLIMYAILGGGLRLNFDLSNVYQVRADNLNSVPGFLGYFVSLLSVILLPITILYSIEQRRLGFLALTFLLQVFFFGMTNFKNILFAPILFVTLFIFLRSPGRAKYLPLLFFALPAIAALNVAYVRFIQNSGDLLFFVNNFIRRLLFTPPMLDERHILFFSDNPFYYWSTSRLSLGLVENPYDLASPFVIGREFFGSETWAANTGMIGSGFSHAGYLGVMIYAVFFGLIIAFLNAYGNRLGHPLVSALAILSILNISRSSDLTTVLLTHSLVFLFVFLGYAPREKRIFHATEHGSELKLRSDINRAPEGGQ